MNNQIRRFALTCLMISFTIIGFSETGSSKGITSDNEVIVGSKTDSSSSVTITTFSIQQNIMSSITGLAGMSITNEQPSLIISATVLYLVFKTTNAAGEHMSVAVELILNNSTLSFQSNSGKEVHVCKGYGNCGSCSFIKSGDRIVSCNCTQTNGSSSAGCNYKASLVH